MKVVGLTGGIGAGKSAVSKILRENNFLVIDTDLLAKNITDRKSVLQEISNAFDKTVLNPDGSLNRSRMAEIIFNDKTQKAILEKIVTEKVIEETKEILEQLKAHDYQEPVIVDAPLLFEYNMDCFTDVNWLVVCDELTRIYRVMAREGISHGKVLERIKNQMPDEEKIKRAQVIIVNSGPMDHLKTQVEQLISTLKG